MECKLMYFSGRHVRTEGMISASLHQAFDEVADRWGVTGDVLMMQDGRTLDFSGDINKLHERDFRNALAGSSVRQ